MLGYRPGEVRELTFGISAQGYRRHGHLSGVRRVSPATICSSIGICGSLGISFTDVSAVPSSSSAFCFRLVRRN